MVKVFQQNAISILGDEIKNNPNMTQNPKY